MVIILTDAYWIIMWATLSVAYSIRDRSYCTLYSSTSIVQVEPEELWYHPVLGDLREEGSIKYLSNQCTVDSQVKWQLYSIFIWDIRHSSSCSDVSNAFS